MTKNTGQAISSLVTSLLIPFLVVACVPARTQVTMPTSAASQGCPATAVPTVTAVATRELTPDAREQRRTPSSTPMPASTRTSPPQTTTPTSSPPLSPPFQEAVAECIRFPSGGTQTTVEGYLPASASKTFVMRVAAGQVVAMDAGVSAMGGGLRFSVVGADGVLVKPMDDAHLRAVFPTTQDYVVELVSDVGAVHYVLSILIPVRIRFAPGATSTEITGTLAADGEDHYVIRGLAGQRFILDPQTTQGRVRLVISGADGQVLLSGRVGPWGGIYDGILPSTQDYLITVRAVDGPGAAYTLEVTIPPL